MGAELSTMQQKVTTRSSVTRPINGGGGGGGGGASVYPVAGKINTIPAPGKVNTIPAAAGKVIKFHSPAKWRTHFEASKSNDKLMVVNFTATWCGPCRNIEPAISEFASRYQDVEFIKIDVDEMMSVAMEFEVHIMPTFILLKKGKTLDVVTGAKKEELQKKIEKNRGNAYRV